MTLSANRGCRIIAVFFLLAGAMAVPQSGSSSPQCRSDAACRLAAQADVMMQNDPAAIEKATLVLMDAIQQDPSLEYQIKLRSYLELLRKPDKIVRHQAPVLVLAISPDGQWLATGDQDGNVTLFDLQTWNKDQQTWNKKSWKHDGQVTKLIFSPDGKYVASAGDDHIAHLVTVDTKTSDEATFGDTPLLHNMAVRTINFSPDSARILTTSDDMIPRVFAVNGDREPLKMWKHPGSIVGAFFGSQGKIITANAGNDRKMRVFDQPDAQKSEAIDLKMPVQLLRMSPDRNWIIATTANNDLIAWFQLENNAAWYNVDDSAANKDSQKCKCKNANEFPHKSNVTAVAFDRYGHWLASGTDQGEVQMHELGSGAEAIHVNNLGTINDLAFSPDLRWLAVASSDKTAHILDAATGREIGRIVHQDQVMAVAFTTDSQFLVTGSFDRTVRISRVVGPSEKLYFHPDGGKVNAVALSKKAQVAIATTSSSDQTPGSPRPTGHLDFFKAQGQKLSGIERPEPLSTLAFSEGNDRFLIVDRNFATHIAEIPGDDDGLKRLKQQTKDPFGWHLASQNEIHVVAFSYDSGTVALADDQGEIRIQYTASTRPILRNPIKYDGAIKALAFSRDGQYLAVSTVDSSENPYKAHIYTVKTGMELSIQPIFQTGEISSLTFSGDDKTLITGAADGQLQFYKINDGVRARPFIPLGSPIRLIKLSTSGKLLCVVTSDRMHIFDAASLEEIASMFKYEMDTRQVAFGDDENSVWAISVERNYLLREFVSVRWFSIANKDIIREACGQILENITVDKWPDLPKQKYQAICERQ
jgi:WD40 repeat protein